MSLESVIAKITDPYERKARLYPALLVLLPVFTIVSSIYGPRASALTAAAATAASCGGLYWLSETCRKRGHELEDQLFKKWGGKPTTQLLRHRDAHLENPTKKRYHAFLGSKLNVPFPTACEELENPAGADDIYQSGVRWLLNHTRPNGDKNFDLLLNENIAYGFRRNLLGVKWIGVAVAGFSAVWVLVSAGVLTLSLNHVLGEVAIRRLAPNALLSLSISFVMLYFWMFSATKRGARFAAFQYAEMLLRSCDILVGMERNAVNTPA